MRQNTNYENTLYPELLTQFNQFDGFYTRFGKYNSATQHITPEMLSENKLLAIRVSNPLKVQKYLSLLSDAYFGEDVETRVDKIYSAYNEPELRNMAETIKNQRKGWLNVLVIPTKISDDLESVVKEFDLAPVLTFDEIPANMNFNDF